jgi:NAD(P)-dependent dehydrogenase (short-subunit alcohol dehydrogenase family)
MQLQGKTIVITGTSSGIGAETARLARFQGARVIGMDRNDASITLDDCIKADLGTVAGIDAAVAQLPAHIDAFYNVAGVPGTADGDLVARVNYLGLRHLTEAVLPRIRRGGAIVNVASILGAEWPLRLDLHKELAAVKGFDAGAQWLRDHPVPHATCYQYFKEALIVWNATQSQEWFMGKGVRMNCVAPGPVFTPILGDFVAMLGEERIQKDAHRMLRPAYADEVAAVMVWLCSDAARWVSGVNIPVDGGLASTYL